MNSRKHISAAGTRTGTMTATAAPGVVVAVTAGVLSFLSPCMIPVVPAFLARIGGLSATDQPSRRHLFVHALAFVVGFSLVFATLGVVLESALTGLGAEIRAWLARVAGVVIVAFGLQLTGLVEFDRLGRGRTLPASDRDPSLAASLVLGGTFAVTWTPCVGPILGSAFAFAATRPAAAFPVLAGYALGLGVPFLLVALVPQRARRVLAGHGRATRRLHRASGAVLLALGVLVFTRRLDLLGTVIYAQETIA